MFRRKLRNFLGAFALFLAVVPMLKAEIITGASIMKLNTPADAAIRHESVTIAADSLKEAIYDWLQRTGQAAPDLNNPVKKHFYSIFAKSCIKSAKQDSYFEGHEWTLNLDIKDAAVRELLAKHNADCQSKASQYWSAAQSAIENKQHVAIYSNCINALFFSMGNFERTEGDQNIEALSRKALQDFMGILKISYSTPIIKGKLGELCQTTVDIKATVGDQPFKGLVLLARLPYGRRIASLTTDDQGTAKLTNFKMPFVAYGTFLHVVPNFGAIVNSGYTFEAKAFSIKLEQSQDQTLIFNTSAPTYNLDYRATAANQVQVPTDFANDVRIRKFLQDSCHLAPAPSGRPAEISIEIQCQVASYQFDDREETDMKTEVQAAVKQNTVGGKSSERTEVLYKKTYDSNHPIPTGLFFWETTNALKQLIKEMLYEL